MNFWKTAPLQFTQTSQASRKAGSVPKVHVTFKKLLICFPTGYTVLISQKKITIERMTNEDRYRTAALGRLRHWFKVNLDNKPREEKRVRTETNCALSKSTSGDSTQLKQAMLIWQWLRRRSTDHILDWCLALPPQGSPWTPCWICFFRRFTNGFKYFYRCSQKCCRFKTSSWLCWGPPSGRKSQKSKRKGTWKLS